MPLFRILPLFSLLVLCLLINGAAQSYEPPQCELQSITAQTSNHSKLNQFEQAKHIAILSKPLLSSGYLRISETGQVIWQTRKPLKSTLYIDGHTLKQFNKHDQLVTSPVNNNQKMSQLITSTFLAILAGDFEQLNKHFSMTINCTDKQWNIMLEAASSDMKRIITDVTIRGYHHIQQLSFSEANGDSTTIEFTPLHDPSINNELGSYFAR